MVDNEVIIKHLMGENEFYRYKLMQAEKQIETLVGQIDYLKGKSRSKRVRKDALKRDGFKCVRCGSPDEIQVHHKVPVSEGGEDALNNVETLCLDCHIEAHLGEPSVFLLSSFKR